MARSALEVAWNLIGFAAIFSPLLPILLAALLGGTYLARRRPGKEPLTRRDIALGAIVAASPGERRPQGIVVFEFFHNGGLGWGMQCSNEATAWGMIFSVFALAAAVLAAWRFRRMPVFSVSTLLRRPDPAPNVT